MNQIPSERRRGNGHKIEKLEFLVLRKDKLLCNDWFPNMFLREVVRCPWRYWKTTWMWSPLDQLNLDDLQRWLPASTILWYWVFSVCLLSHHWEYLKNRQKTPAPQKKRIKPPSTKQCKHLQKNPTKQKPNKTVIHYVKHCDHRLCWIAKNFE